MATTPVGERRRHHDKRRPAYEFPRRRGAGGADGLPDSDSPRERAYLVMLALDRPSRVVAHVDRLGMLATALTLALPRGNLRVFANEDALKATLLGQLGAGQRTGASAAHGMPVDSLARPLPALDAKPPVRHTGPNATAEPGLIEPLTARERQVLALLATGRSNRGIAAELYVTLDTVKKHVGRVLNKLSATNRTEAAARARQLGLIG